MKGQTLVEVLVALGIIAVVTTALAAVVITSMGTAQFSKNQNLATQYAQEGMEITRRLRDSDYVGFRGYDGTYCLDKGSSILTPLSGCTSPNPPHIDNFFIRTVTIVQSACGGSVVGNMADIAIDVSWQSSKCSTINPFCHSSRLTSCFSTVNPVPTL